MRTGYFFKDLYNEGVHQGDRYVYQTSSVGLPGVPPEYQRPRLYAERADDLLQGPGERSAPRHPARRHALLSPPPARTSSKPASSSTASASTRSRVRPATASDFSGARARSGPAARSGTTELTQQRPPAKPRVRHAGQRDGEQPRALRAGRLDDRQAAHGRSGSTDGERERAVALAGPPSPEDRDPVRLRRQAGPSLRPRLGCHRRRKDEGVRLLGRFLRHHEAAAVDFLGGPHSVVYWYTLDSGDIGGIVDNPDCPPTCPGRLIRTSGGTVLRNDPDDNRIDPDLGQMRLQEAVVASSARSLRNWRSARATSTSRSIGHSRISARVTGRVRSRYTSVIRASAVPRRSFPQAGRFQSPFPRRSATTMRSSLPSTDVFPAAARPISRTRGAGFVGTTLALPSRMRTDVWRRTSASTSTTR